MCYTQRFEAPTNIGSGKRGGEALLGTLAFRSERQAFGVKADDRRRHIAIVGKTGMGKSTLLERLIISDMQAGRGVGLVDPHGDLADAVLKAVPKRRTADVALLDASDRDYPPAFNPLACSDPLQRPLVASGVVSAFSLWDSLLKFQHDSSDQRERVMAIRAEARIGRGPTAVRR